MDNNSKNMNELELSAVNFSIKGDWSNALKTNLQILKKDPRNLDALNRLSYSYIQLSKAKEAKIIVLKVLKIDPFNMIAKKNLSLLTQTSKSAKKPAECLEAKIDFIENPGTTKLVSLICPAPKTTLEKIRNGAALELKIKCRRISILHDTVYIGKFPDDLSRKFIPLIEKKCRYEIFFKSFSPKKLAVVINIHSNKSPRRN